MSGSGTSGGRAEGAGSNTTTVDVKESVSGDKVNIGNVTHNYGNTLWLLAGIISALILIVSIMAMIALIIWLVRDPMIDSNDSILPPLAGIFIGTGGLSLAIIGRQLSGRKLTPRLIQGTTLPQQTGSPTAHLPAKETTPVNDTVLPEASSNSNPQSTPRLIYDRIAQLISPLAFSLLILATFMALFVVGNAHQLQDSLIIFLELTLLGLLIILVIIPIIMQIRLLSGAAHNTSVNKDPGADGQAASSLQTGKEPVLTAPAHEASPGLPVIRTLLLNITNFVISLRNASSISIWILTGIALYITSEVILGLLVNQPRLPLSQFLTIVGVAMLVVVYTQWHHHLIPVLTEFSEFLDEDKAGVSRETWKNHQMKMIFGLSFPAIIITGIVTAIAYFVMFQLTFPFTGWFSGVPYVALGIIAPVGGHGVYMAAALYRLLYRLGQLPLKLTIKNFYRIPHPVVFHIYDYYIQNFSVVMVLAYLWLLTLIFVSGYESSLYGFKLPFIAVLVVLAFFPFPAFLFTYWRVRVIASNIKQANIDMVNGLVANQFGAILKPEQGKVPDIGANSSAEDQSDYQTLKNQFDLLQTEMELQNKLRQRGITISRFGAMVIGTVSLLTTVLNTVVTVNEVKKMIIP